MKPARKDMPAARGEVVTPRFRRWFANGLGNRKGSAFPQTDGIGLQAVSEVSFPTHHGRFVRSSAQDNNSGKADRREKLTCCIS